MLLQLGIATFHVTAYPVCVIKFLNLELNGIQGTPFRRLERMKNVHKNNVLHENVNVCVCVCACVCTCVCACVRSTVYPQRPSSEEHPALGEQRGEDL